jgi:hypothetical protein
MEVVGSDPVFVPPIVANSGDHDDHSGYRHTLGKLRRFAFAPDAQSPPLP